MVSNILEIAAFISFIVGMFIMYVPFGFISISGILYVIALITKAQSSIEDEAE